MRGSFSRSDKVVEGFLAEALHGNDVFFVFRKSEQICKSPDRPYTYLIPDALPVQAGVRVTVPFGRGNRRSEGFVLEVSAGEADERCKPIDAVLDDAPLLGDELLRLVRWMKARYFCTYYDAIRTILPSGVWFRYQELWRLAAGLDADTALAAVPQDSVEALVLREIAAAKKGAETQTLEKTGGDGTAKALKALKDKALVTVEKTAVQTVSDKTLRMVSLAMEPEDALAAVEKKRSTASVRYAVVALLCAQGTLSSPDVCYYTGASSRTLRSLEKDGIIRLDKQEVLRVPTYAPEAAQPVVLSVEQRSAFEGLDALARSGAAKVALLHGVTASGKTQVYIRLIEEALSRGKTALLLVPEIALTPQMMAKFTAHFGDRVAMLHSALRLTERYDQWKRIRRGDVKVVLGTRSAVFAPLTNLGLIIMDEEQEGTYTSENPPRYQTRDIAQFRCARQNALLLLGSATPTGAMKCFTLTGDTTSRAFRT